MSKLFIVFKKQILQVAMTDLLTNFNHLLFPIAHNAMVSVKFYYFFNKLNQQKLVKIYPTDYYFLHPCHGTSRSYELLGCVD